MTSAKIGSVFYFLWGVLHIGAAFEQFTLAKSLEYGLVQGKINQGAWDLLVFSLLAIVIAVNKNWKNDTLGYWLNLVVVSAADIGFIIFVLGPRHIALFPGILGPIFWILGIVFSTIGISTKSTDE